MTPMQINQTQVLHFSGINSPIKQESPFSAMTEKTEWISPKRRQNEKYEERDSDDQNEMSSHYLRQEPSPELIEYIKKAGFTENEVEKLAEFNLNEENAAEMRHLEKKKEIEAKDQEIF